MLCEMSVNTDDKLSRVASFGVDRRLKEGPLIGLDSALSLIDLCDDLNAVAGVAGVY